VLLEYIAGQILLFISLSFLRVTEVVLTHAPLLSLF
jgi:hypothetical protein